MEVVYAFLNSRCCIDFIIDDNMKALKLTKVHNNWHFQGKFDPAQMDESRQLTEKVCGQLLIKNIKVWRKWSQLANFCKSIILTSYLLQ